MILLLFTHGVVRERERELEVLKLWNMGCRLSQLRGRMEIKDKDPMFLW